MWGIQVLKRSDASRDQFSRRRILGVNNRLQTFEQPNQVEDGTEDIFEEELVEGLPIFEKITTIVQGKFVARDFVLLQ